MELFNLIFLYTICRIAEEAGRYSYRSLRDILRKRSEVPKYLRHGYFWRCLRGGIWLHSVYGWTRATKEEPSRLAAILYLRDSGWHVEDHRWYF